MLVLLLIIFCKRKRIRKIKLNARFFIHSSNIFIRSKDVYFAVEKPPIQLEKQTQKKERKKFSFTLSFQKKAASVVVYMCASRFFGRNAKNKPQAGEGGAKRRSSRSSSSKKKKKHSEFHRRRTQQRALENRNFTHHSLVLSSLSRSLYSFIRFLPSVPVMGAKFLNVFFYIFSFCFFPSCELFLSSPTQKKKFFGHLTRLLSFSSLSIAFVFVLFLR